MAAFGSLALLTTRRLDEPVAVARRVAEIVGASKVEFVLATRGKDRSYKKYRRSMRRLRGRLIYAASEVESDFERIAHRVPLEDSLAVYRRGRALTLDFGHHATISKAIYEAYEPRIDEEHFGDFMPCEPGVTIGPHDFWLEDFDLDEVVYVARPFFRLSFCGWGYPLFDSMQGLTDMLLENPVIQDVRGRVEAIVGPLDAVTDWSC